jgi:hypothetical protein
MFPSTDSLAINQRCWQEALSVQDRLTPAPPRRWWGIRLHVRLVTAAGRFCERTRGGKTRLQRPRHSLA